MVYPRLALVYNDTSEPVSEIDPVVSELKFIDDVDMKTKYKFDFDKITDDQQTALFEILDHIRCMRSEWNYLTPFNLEKGNQITTSWKYEYGIFELVRIYKSFDWKKNVMFYYGY